MIIDGRGRAGTIYKTIKVSAAKTGKNVVLLKYQTAIWTCPHIQLSLTTLKLLDGKTFEGRGGAAPAIPPDIPSSL